MSLSTTLIRPPGNSAIIWRWLSPSSLRADLLVMPDDDKRREIVEGELFVTRSLSALLGNARILISWER